MREDWEKPGDMLYEFTIDRSFNKQPMISVKQDNTSAPARWCPGVGWHRDV